MELRLRLIGLRKSIKDRLSLNSVLVNKTQSRGLYGGFFKRLMDFILSMIGLLVLSPLILFTAIILFCQNKGNVFFYQERPGWMENPFKIVKFKSMTDEKDVNGNLLPDSDRITKFGGMVRKLSIDELPQLFNVLKGDMSLVGPRPLLFKYIPLYSERQKMRMHVRPGITGWAQVNGRNSIPWKDKFEKDIYYVENVTFLLDLKILWMTVLKVLKREGINQTEQRPMEPFNGSN